MSCARPSPSIRIARNAVSLLADFLSTRKDHPAAEQALLEAATQLPHSTKIQFGLAALYPQERAGCKGA